MASRDSRTLTVTFLGNTGQLEQAFKRVGTQVNGLQAASKKMQSAGKTLTRNVTLPIIGLGIAAGKAAIDFQAAMERIHTQAGASQKAVAQLSKGVLDLSGKVGIAPNVLADGMYHVTSSLNATLPAAKRVSTELKVLKVAAEGARVGNANLVDVTNALDAAIVSGIKGVTNYQQAMGALNAVVGAGDMTMQDLADALGTGLLAPMKTYGLTLKDVGGALAVFGDNNIRGADAATKLTSAVRIMAAPSKAASKALKGINLSTLQLANDMRAGGLIKALSDLKKHLKDSGDTASQQGLVIARAFGGRQSLGVQVLLNQLDRLKSKTTEVGQGATGFASAWAATQKTAAQKTAEALSMIKADLIRFGNDALPTLLKIGGTVVNDVDKVAKAFGSLPAGLKTAIIKGGLILAAVGPALKILGFFTGAVGKLLQVARIAAVLAKTGSIGAARGVSGGASVPAVSGAAASAGAAGSASLASKLGGLVMRGIGIAGLALIAAPFAIALGKGVGIFIDKYAEADGKKFADKFLAPLPKAVQDKFGPALTKAAQQVTNLEQRRGPGGALGVAPSTAPGSKLGAGLNLPGAAAAAAKESFNAFFQQGFLAGQAVVKGLNSVKHPTTPILIQDFLMQLHKLPAQAQPEAAKVMLSYAEGLAQKGKLPRRAVDSMIATLEQAFPQLRTFMMSQGIQTDQGLAATLKFTTATATLKNTLAGYRQQFGDWSISTKLTEGNINQNTARAMSHLHDIISVSSGKTRRDAVAEFNRLKSQVSTIFGSMGKKVAAAAGDMQKSVADGSFKAYQIGARNWGAFAKSVANAVASGALATQDAMTVIADALNSTLKAFGEKPLAITTIKGMTPAQIQAVASGQVSSGGAASPHARGGLTQVGRLGQGGRDTVPMNVGGVPIKVAPGEQVAVFNRHQQPEINAALMDRGYAGLRGFFARNRKPNYMAMGGMVPGFAGGGIGAGLSGLGSSAVGPVVLDPGVNMSVGQEPQILSDLHRLAAELRNTVYVISGYRSPAHSIAVGGFGNDPHTRGQAADIGIGSPSLASMFGVAESQLRAVGLYRPFYPADPHEVNHVQLLAGGAQGALSGALGALAPMFKKLKVPEVTGSGTIARLVRAAAKKATDAANAYGQKQVNKLGGAVGGSVGGTGSITAANLEAITKSLGYSWSPADIQNWLRIIAQESGGNPLAQNPTSTAFGIGQFLDSTWGSYGTGPKTSNAHLQLVYMAEYIHGKYGTPSAAEAYHLAHNSYASGGFVQPPYEKKLQGKFAGVTDFLHQMWSVAAPLYHRGGRNMPPVTYTQGQDALFAGVDATGGKPGNRQFFMPKWLMTGKHGLAAHDPTMAGLVLHEWTHEFQRNDIIDRIQRRVDPKARRVNVGEGGAQAFANLIAGKVLPRVGIRGNPHLHDPGDIYTPYENWVMGHLGANWVRNKQFGFGNGGLPFVGSFAKGTTDVPQTGLALVHKGETIIPNGAGSWAGVHGVVGTLGKLDQVAAQTSKTIRALTHQLAEIDKAEKKAKGNEKKQLDALKVATGQQLAAAKHEQTLAQKQAARMLAGFSVIPSQSVGNQITASELGNAVTLAQNSGSVPAQKKAYQNLLKAERGWLSADKRKLRSVNRALGKRGLSRGQRAALLQDKLALLQEVGTLEGDIGSTEGSITGLGSGSGTGTDPNQALVDALKAQTDALTQLQGALTQQTVYMKSVGEIEKRQAIKALSDMISGQIAGNVLSRATGSAGDGSVARYGSVTRA